MYEHEKKLSVPFERDNARILDGFCEAVQLTVSQRTKRKRSLGPPCA